MPLLQDRLARLVERVTDHFSEGFTVQLLKRNTLSGSALADGGGSAALKTPIATAGATTLVLTSSANLSGILYSGSPLTIAGDPTTYHLTSNAVGTAKTITVSFSPALVQSTSSGLSVSTSNPPAYTFSALSGKLTEEETTDLEIINPRKLYLTTANIRIEPEFGDVIIDDVGSDPIERLYPMSPGFGKVGWAVVIGKS